MNRMIKLIRIGFAICVIATTPLILDAQQAPEQKVVQPEDLFRVRRVGAIAWSPNGQFAAIELTRPGYTLDSSVPTNEIELLDVKTRTFRTLSSNAAAYLGFFSAAWSPDGKRLAFLSVDADANVRLWILRRRIWS